MLHKGDKYRDVDGTLFQVFSAMDDTYTYYFIANLSRYTVTRTLPKNAEIFIKDMEKLD